MPCILIGKMLNYSNLLVLVFLVLGLGAAMAQQPVIGVAAPLSGTSEALGKQLVEGARAAADGNAVLEVFDDGCSADGGAVAARRMIEAGARVVVGFLCTESIEAAMPILKEAGIPVITPGVRTASLTDRRSKTGWPVYRLAPRDDDEAEAFGALLAAHWRDGLFAVVDDGTIYGRDLAETLRVAAQQKGLKPIFVDTYRPQMENQVGLAARLRRAGAVNVAVGGDRDDIAIMARDAAGLGAAITFAGSESLRSASGGVPLAVGTLMVGLPEWADIANPAVLEILKQRDILPEGYVLPAFAAMQIAIAVAATATEPLTGPYATALGEIRFDAKGDLPDNPYRLFRYDGARFVPLETP